MAVQEETPTNDVAEQWEDIDNICILCDQPMASDKTCVVKERGLERFKKSSKRRKDDKHKQLEGLQQATFHKSCSVTYSRESNIQTAEKTRKENAKNSAKNRQRQQEGRVFNFFMYCFFCSGNVYEHKDNCRRVYKRDTIDNIVAQLKVYPKTEINQIIFSRLSNLQQYDDDYLNDHKLYYHTACLSKFYALPPIKRQRSSN